MLHTQSNVQGTLRGSSLNLWRILANTIHATGGTSSDKNNSPALRGELKDIHMKNILVSLCLLLLVALRLYSQETADGVLYKVIMRNDSLLFNIGFNTCNVQQFEQLLSNDFRFFHDKDSISGKTGFLNGIKNGLCKSPETYQSRRELLPGSTKIYPLYKGNILYGAIQEGVHRFYESINGNKESYGSTARFTHVWILEDNNWKLHTSLSFDHKK